jgi:release factor glutamine methyltransferase
MADPPAAKEQSAGPPTRHVLLAEGARCLAAAAEGAGVGDARREAEWLLADVLGALGRAALHARVPRRVTRDEARRFRALLRRRAEGEPLAYVLGHTDFLGLRLAVSPAVLIPRPETETLVEAALRRLEDVRQPKVLDAGTGSGCIALALASERPEADVHACDVSREALAVARANADACDLAAHFFRADMQAGAFLEKSPAGLDLLIANPPYVPDAERPTLPEAVRNHEPGVALFSGGDPLHFYRALAKHASQMLVPGGHLVLEAHAGHAEAVAALLREGGLKSVGVEQDAFGKERVVAGRWGA